MSDADLYERQNPTLSDGELIELEEAEILEENERECGLILPQWEIDLIHGCMSENFYLEYGMEGSNYRDFPGDERSFDWGTQDEMYREDAAGLS